MPVHLVESVDSSEDLAMHVIVSISQCTGLMKCLSFTNISTRKCWSRLAVSEILRSIVLQVFAYCVIIALVNTFFA